MSYVIGTVHTEAVRASLESPNPEINSDVNLGALMRAALIGHSFAVRSLLDRGLSVDSLDQNRRTPLMEAVFGGHIETVQEFLERGANVNAQDCDGWTALMEAAAKGRSDLVKLLLASGADARLTNKNGWTALKTTAKCNVEIARLLRAAGAA